MKRISLLLTGMILFCGCLAAQNDKINFNETEHDFGLIGEKNGNATFEFVLINNSNAPVVISNATASCGCTKPSWTKQPIEPGKTGTISVSYNPVGRIGSFAKNITVYTNAQQTPYILKIKGVVQAGVFVKKTPEEEYPVAMGSFLLKSKMLDYGKIGLKEIKTVRLEVFNNSDKPVSPKTVKLPKYLTVVLNPATIPAKTAGTMDVTLNVQENNLYGNLSGDFKLLINQTPQSFPYSATVLDDFSQWSATKKANAGKIATSTEINFGNLSSGNSRTLKISNSGKSVLNIRSIQSADPSITVSKSTLAINPGEIVEVKVSIDGKKIRSQASSKLMIISDDPSAPVYEVNILANK